LIYLGVDFYDSRSHNDKFHKFTSEFILVN